MTFKDGTTSLGTGTLSNGTATFSTSSLGAGGHSITAIYGGNASYGGSTSTGLAQTVNAASTTTSLASSANPSTFNQAVTFTATVSPGTASGTVTFKDGTISLGTGSLSNGTATFGTSSLGIGGHSITAVYSGDNNYNGSTSSALAQTVNQASTATGLTSSANPSLIGQSVTFTATVNPAPDGGTLAFNDGGVAITGCTAQALIAGKATCPATYTASGSHTITAVYSGNADFLASTSSPLTQTVGLNITTTSLSSSISSSIYGQPVTFTVTVSPGAASGIVTFKDGTTSVGTGTLSNGTATFSTSILAAGGHSMTAVYGGNTTYGGSTSNSLSQSVSLASTTTTLSSSRNPSTFGAHLRSRRWSPRSRPAEVFPAARCSSPMGPLPWERQPSTLPALPRSTYRTSAWEPISSQRCTARVPTIAPVPARR